MHYLGHFTFDEIGEQGEPRHGYFTCVVEAENPDTAAGEFKELINNMKRGSEIFFNVTTVYLEDMIEMKSIPNKAVTIRFQSSSGEFPESISHPLPGIVSSEFRVYGLAEDVRREEATENEEDGDEYGETTPFVDFSSLHTETSARRAAEQGAGTLVQQKRRRGAHHREEEQAMSDSDRDLYVEKLKAQIDQWKADLDKLDATGRKADADAKLKVKDRVSALRVRIQEMERNLAGMREGSAEAWKDFKQGAERAWAALEEGFKKAKSDLRSNP